MAQLWAGMVVAGYGGFYQVQIADGAVIICRARGRLKQQYAGIYVGDQVEISIISGTDGVLENILPRKNQLLRPKIANVSQAVLVQAAREPAYDLYLLDKMLVVAGLQGIKPLICFNKADLAAPGELEQIAAVYRCAGYVCCGVSALSGAGIADLLCYFGEGITVLAGPSGVGKSSLLNQLVPGMTAKTGEISVRLQRGKHTTRYATIMPLLQGGGMIADTPGFSLLDVPETLSGQLLADLYPEFAAAAPCRFESCLHDQEPDCGVKRGLAQGGIDPGRYQRYIRLLQEVRTREVKYK